jgi:prolyl oligopeptidase
MRSALLTLATALALAAPLAAHAAPPPTRVEMVVDTLHGVAVPDPYRWLEDQDAPATRAWIDAQAAYTRAALERFPGRPRLVTKLRQLIEVDQVSVPIEAGGRLFYSKRAAGQDQRVLMVRAGAGPELVVLDPHPLSADHTTSVNYLDVSRDGALAAIGTRLGGADEQEVRVLDVVTRRAKPDRLPRARYFSVAIAGDGRGLYYARALPEGPRVFFHPFGGDPARDTRLFGDGYGPEYLVSMALSDDRRWMVISVTKGSAALRNELWVRDLAGGGAPVAIAKDLDGLTTGAIGGGMLYVRTTWQAPRGRVMRVDLRDPARDHWRELVPQGAGVIEGLSLVGGRLFVRTLEDVVSKVRVFGPEGRALGQIAFPTLGSVSSVGGRWDGSAAWFSYSSFTVPPTIFRYDVAGGVRSEWWRSGAPVTSARYETEQVWVVSRDGTRVPMFLVHRKGLARDGRRPVLLTGYGGFAQSQTPRFNAEFALWAEQGGVVALPGLRGGAEFGEEWHRAAMLAEKQNTFDDFIAAAEWLTSSGWTDRDHLAIRGGSNGGLLVGAFFTQRPELCRAAICSVPLLDMIRYHRFLVAKYWVPEYGSADDPAQFPALWAYSPYHHVTDGVAYPAVMFVSGDSDTRVAPLHARKMTARLQAATASDPDERPVLLHYDVTSGHSGGKPTGREIEDTADELVFLFAQLGVSGTAPVPIDTPLGGTRP